MCLNIKDRKNVLLLISEIRFNAPSEIDLLHDQLIDRLIHIALDRLNEGMKVNHINDMIRKVRKHKKENKHLKYFLKGLDDVYEILNSTKL